MTKLRLYRVRKLLQTSLFVLTVLFVSCDPNKEFTASQMQEVEVEKIIPNGNEKFLTGDSELIFDQESFHTFEINVPASNLERINADPSAEKYVEASLTFDGETVSPVGLRYKGSIGAFVNCLSGNDWANPSGYKTCTKLSMKVKINWDSDVTFYGLKKLQFHSQNLDNSQMRERLGYWLFREMGVSAPRSVHAKVIINGIYYGVYALTEQIDGRFTRQNFDDGSGNLYKEVWPLDMNGNAFNEQHYLNYLKTNEDENPNAKIIHDFASQLSAAEGTAVKSVISSFMDVDEIMSYVAVDRTIRHDDGPFHWYCGEGQCSNHNYYWYEDPTENKLSLIPWDLDNAFENIIANVNPVTPIADEWGEVTNACEPFSYGFFQSTQRSAACDKLTAGWVMHNEEYQQALEKLMKGPFTQAESKLDEWQSQIRTATVQASNDHDDALRPQDWDNALTNMKSSLVIASSK